MDNTDSCSGDLRNIEQVLQHADCLIDEQSLRSGLDRMASEISRSMSGLNPVVLCVMVGGIYAAAQITSRLNFPLEIDYLQVTRYQNTLHGGELIWRIKPEINLSGRHVLIVDDILDEGVTLDEIIKEIRACHPASVRSAMLLRKIHNRRKTEHKVDFIGFDVEDRYVFGAGLDYKGYFRQLPAVYAAART